MKLTKVMMILVVLTMFSLSAQSQDRYISLNGMYSSNIPYAGGDKIFKYRMATTNLRYGIQTVGNNQWEDLYKFPRYGLGIQYTNFFEKEGRETIGDFWSIYPFVYFPVIRKPKLTAGIDLALGLGVGFNPYDSVSNPKNILLGTSVNAYISISAEADFMLSDRMQAYANLGFDHYSNGKFSDVNLGLNNLHTSLGMRYYLGPKTTLPERKNNVASDRKMEYDLMWNFGFRYTGVSDNGNHRYIQVIQPSIQWTLNKRNRVGLATDAMFYMQKENSPTHLYRIGMLGTYEMTVSRFSGIMQFGGWIYNTEGLGSFYYERAGVRYRFSPHFKAHVAIRAAGLVADAIEWGLVYTF